MLGEQLLLLLYWRNHLHPVCTFSTALHLGYVSIISPFGSGNRHLLNILLAQTSKTLYFSIAPLLRQHLCILSLASFSQLFHGELTGLGGMGSAGKNFLGTNLGFCFDACGAWLSLPCARHAQWKQAKPPRGEEEFQGQEGATLEPSESSHDLAHLIWLEANGSMLWASWEFNELLRGVNWFSVPVTNPNRTWCTRVSRA